MKAWKTPTVEIAVEAGDWGPEQALQRMAARAVGAAVAVLPLSGGVPLTRSAVAESASSQGGEETLHSPSASPQGRERPSATVSPLPGHPPQGGKEVSILFTDNAAVQRLNAQYRGKDKPTNVLSFPQSAGPLLGDIVLAYETVRDEAGLAGKPIQAHMAHLIIHGFLHLLGYDHEREDEAETMEALEREALEKIGIADPYAARSD